MRKVFFFLDYSFFRCVFRFLKVGTFDSELYFWSRRSFIVPIFKGQVFFFYNGMRFYRLIVTRSMFYYCFSNFVFTKLRGFSIHLRKRER